MRLRGRHQTQVSSCSTGSLSHFTISDSMRRTHGGTTGLRFLMACAGNSIRLPRRQGSSIRSLDLVTSLPHEWHQQVHQCTGQPMPTLPLASGWLTRSRSVPAEKPWQGEASAYFTTLERASLEMLRNFSRIADKKL